MTPIYYPILVYFLFRTTVVIQRVFWSPLRRYPGPWIYAASHLPLLWSKNVTGEWPRKLKALHDKYGDAVRISPDEISYIDPQAWEDIYGFKKGGAPEFSKDPKDHSTLDDSRREANIISSNSENHRRQRKLLSHAFSEHSLRDQEPLLRGYVDLFLQRLDEHRHEHIDICQWLNYTTFDMMGELGFGEPFDCLQNSTYHEWINIIFRSLRIGSRMNAIKFYPVGAKLLDLLIPKRFLAIRNRHTKLASDKADKRIEKGVTSQQDFMTAILKHNDEKGMSKAEIRETTGILIIAGSETTATALSGMVYNLSINRGCYSKVVEEVRTTYQSDKDITLLTAKSTPYLEACIQETMRLFPPVPGTLHRQVPRNGGQVLGQYLPGGTFVGCPHWAMYHSSRNFTSPMDFRPERWLANSGPEFTLDRKQAFQPFSYGPRNCIGKNLAYAEMRLIISQMIWNFDFELAPESVGWADGIKAFVLWDKPALLIKVKRASRSATT